MKLPDAIRRRLAQEYKYAATRMQKSPNPIDKLYFFSVFYGEANRALNWSWDRDLALAHMVLKTATEQINSRSPRLRLSFPVKGHLYGLAGFPIAHKIEPLLTTPHRSGLQCHKAPTTLSADSCGVIRDHCWPLSPAWPSVLPGHIPGLPG